MFGARNFAVRLSTRLKTAIQRRGLMRRSGGSVWRKMLYMALSSGSI